jgi:sulfur-oxidizing protein SoxY
MSEETEPRASGPDARQEPRGPGLPAGISRRAALSGGAALLLVRGVEPASATPEAMRAVMRTIVGDAQVRKGRVKLDLPPLVENGNTVPLTVTVESPMTARDHVRAIHVLNEKNPQPYVITVHLDHRAGSPNLSTRIKLGDSQRVIALAQMSDGSFWSGEQDVIVTIAACLENF